MNTKLAKCFTLLIAVLMLATCLPIVGMAETVNKSTMNVILGRTTRLYLDEVARTDLESYFEEHTPDYLNQNLTFAIEKVGQGITVTDKQLTYKIWEEDGQTYYTIPHITLMADSVKAQGESIVLSVYVKPEKKTYRYEIALSMAVTKDPIVSATAATKVEKTEYGTYSITAEEGSFITITPVYEDVNGKKLAMEVEWYTYDYDTGYSDLLSKQSTHTFEVTQALNGDDLEWHVNLPSVDFEDGNWISLTVVPKGTLSTAPATGNSTPSVPNTGDNSNPLLWLAGVLMAGTGCAVLLMKRRQNG